jgi:CubicO group peptidase (beta-lactamase class C family)
MRAGRLLTLMLLHLACGDAERPPRGLDELRLEVEHRLDEAASDGWSGSALVTVGGVHIVARGYGLADREQQIPNTPGTAYDVGSVMKDLTAAAIFKLQGEGALAVRDSLATIFDDVPADKAAITLLQVIQHTAGFREYHDTDGDFEPMTRLEARQRILAQELLFAPGSDEGYSNSGYTLLADVVETVSGRDFTDYVRAELLDPAGMRDSGFYGDAVWDRVDTAIGYDAAIFQDNDPAHWPYTWALIGNGGLVATVGDLERWFAAVEGGGVLGPAALAAYRADYLAGMSGQLVGQTVFAVAGGGDYGLGGFAVDCPALETRVVIATNRSDAFDIEEFGVELSELVLSR